MAQRLTPIIGLAVAAALVLAAVFGVVSLTPAYAGVETPDARGLTETDFTPQAGATEFGGVPVETDGTASAGDPVVVNAGVAQNLRLAVGSTATLDLDAVFSDPDPAADQAITFRKLELVDGRATSAAPVPNPSPELVSLVVPDPTPDDTTDPLPDLDMDPGQVSMNEATTPKVVTITALAEGRVILRAQAETSGGTTHAYVTFEVVVVAATGTFEPSSNDPGDDARYKVIFYSPTDLVAGSSEITIELEDYNLPGNITRTNIGLTSDAVYDRGGDEDAGIEAHGRLALGATLAGDNYRAGVQTPDDVSVSGEKITITVGNMNPERDTAIGINQGDRVEVLIRQGAGITNPTEGGSSYKAVVTNNEESTTINTNTITVPRLVDLSEDDGGRGTVVTATGKGFKNGVSLGFFLDVPSDHDNDPETALARNGIRDPGEIGLCDVASVGSDDTGSCEFTVNNPPFSPGDNFVGAMDGRGQPANKSDTHMDGDQKFTLDPSISASPDNGNPGDSILIQMYDFDANATVTLVDLARQVERNANTPNTVSHNASSTGVDGSANFRMTVPNWAPEGRLDLKVTAGGKSDNITITVGGPQVTVTPGTVLANQRISVVGTGFTPNSRVCCGTKEGEETIDPVITFGGEEIPATRINDGDDVSVDNGGNWSTSIDVPLTQITSDEGSREVSVRDSYGRVGDVDVTVPARVVTIDPPSGRVGTTAVVRGENFPSKNDEGDSFNVEITYTAGSDETRVSTVPDASGRFETEIRIPTSANIPSTNTVRVVFEYGDQDTPITTTVTHDVPSGGLTLSANSGAPGDTITLRGDGFKAYVPVQEVKVGSIEVTPTPAPSTDAQGGLEFDINIPGIDTGIQTIEVQVSGTTASIGFNVRPPAAVGSETAVDVAVAPLGDNFLRAFNFNNDSKSWTFYDPAVGDASTMTHFIGGSSYWILVGQDASVILNRKSRNLTCKDGNCWNLIVW